jgi:hypothetical protein
VAGLDVDADVSFDKFNIRHRANALLQHLWNHPLREPRASVLAFATSTDPEGWEAFVVAALDTVM